MEAKQLMVNEVEQAQAEVIEEFGFFDNWMDRYQYIIDLGKRLPDLDASERVEENQIKGCQSQVWFVAETKDDRLNFRAISDAAIVSGLIAILLRIYSGKKPSDILASSTEFVEALGLAQHLSPTRSNGLDSMLAAIQRFAAQANE
ncbi:MAG: SufE family protein [Woeseiaceae bacterium]|nr:SufE family protein [Woeseiaceae bacterium]